MDDEMTKERYQQLLNQANSIQASLKNVYERHKRIQEKMVEYFQVDNEMYKQKELSDIKGDLNFILSDLTENLIPTIKSKI